MKKIMKKQNNKGFSLVELIVVIAIMAVLIGVLAPQFLGNVEKARRSSDLTNSQELAAEIAVTLSNAEADGSWGTLGIPQYTGSGTIPWTTIPQSGETNPLVSVRPDPKAVSGTYVYYLSEDGKTVHVGIKVNNAGTVKGATGSVALTTTDVLELFPAVTGKGASVYGN